MSISICIATYGESSWEHMAQTRALPSVFEQDCEIVIVHDASGTVSSSRNTVAKEASGDWLCFLDADDELDSGFCEAMRKVIDERQLAGWGPGFLIDTGLSILTPSVSYANGRRRTPPKFWPDCSLDQGNPCAIGTLIERVFFHEIGGFIDYGDPPGSNAYEDWSLWARAHIAGATVVKVPDAVYIAHHEKTSRHRGVPVATKLAWHREIECSLWPERCA